MYSRTVEIIRPIPPRAGRPRPVHAWGTCVPRRCPGIPGPTGWSKSGWLPCPSGRRRPRAAGGASSRIPPAPRQSAWPKSRSPRPGGLAGQVSLRPVRTRGRWTPTGWDTARAPHRAAGFRCAHRGQWRSTRPQVRAQIGSEGRKSGQLHPGFSLHPADKQGGELTDAQLLRVVPILFAGHSLQVVFQICRLPSRQAHAQSSFQRDKQRGRLTPCGTTRPLSPQASAAHLPRQQRQMQHKRDECAVAEHKTAAALKCLQNRTDCLQIVAVQQIQGRPGLPAVQKLLPIHLSQLRTQPDAHCPPQIFRRAFHPDAYARAPLDRRAARTQPLVRRAQVAQERVLRNIQLFSEPLCFDRLRRRKQQDEQPVNPLGLGQRHAAALQEHAQRRAAVLRFLQPHALPGLRTKRNPAARSHFSIPGNSRMTVRRLTPTLSPQAAAVSHTGGSSDNLRISRRPLSVSIGDGLCAVIAIPPLISLFVYSYHITAHTKKIYCPRPAGRLGRRQFWPCRLVPNPYISRLFPRYSRQITQICHACLDIMHKCPAFGTIISGQLCHKSCLSCRAPAGTMEPQNESPSVSPSRRTGHIVPRQ